LKKSNVSALKSKSTSKFGGSKNEGKSGAKKVKLDESVSIEEWLVWPSDHIILKFRNNIKTNTLVNKLIVL
jgi:hypothetical protein